MNRSEYKTRAIEIAPRGNELPHAKLTPEDVEDIRSAAVQRERLRGFIRDSLSNAALANRFGVHRRTIEKVLQRESWINV
jgi:IS30 family transposase